MMLKKSCYRLLHSRRYSITVGLALITSVLFLSTIYRALPNSKYLQCPGNQYLNGSSLVREDVKSVEFIDIIGIGIYTWHHLLNGSLDFSDKHKKVYTSHKTIDGISFKYKLKCCHPNPDEDFTIDNEDRNVILAMWGRNGPSSIKMIRKAIKDPSIRNLALLIFGDEHCYDIYLREALACNKLRFVYITHESTMIDNKRVFLWPLGTQMVGNHAIRYLSPFINAEPVDLDSVRRYTSTFIGETNRAVRNIMVKAVTSNEQLFDNDEHLFSFRPSWKDELSPTVGDVYGYSLRNSDLTLSPQGNAPECYRTFEALESGSIPIIEDAVAARQCNRKRPGIDETFKAPYRIFKEYGAPVYYVKSWTTDLSKIVREFRQLPPAEKKEKRRKVYEWYAGFKVKLGRKLIDDVQTFFV